MTIEVSYRRGGAAAAAAAANPEDQIQYSTPYHHRHLLEFSISIAHTICSVIAPLSYHDEWCVICAFARMIMHLLLAHQDTRATMLNAKAGTCMQYYGVRCIRTVSGTVIQ